MDEKVPGSRMHPSTLQFFQRAQAQVRTREEQIHRGTTGSGEASSVLTQRVGMLDVSVESLRKSVAEMKGLADKAAQEQGSARALVEKTAKVQEAIVGDLKRIVDRVQQNTRKAADVACLSFGRAAKRLQLYASPSLTGAALEGVGIEQDERVCFAGPAITVEGDNRGRVWRAVRRIYTNGHIAQAYVVFSDDGKTLNFDSFALS
jgi:hypothetical protein